MIGHLPLYMSFANPLRKETIYTQCNTKSVRTKRNGDSPRTCTKIPNLLNIVVSHCMPVDTKITPKQKLWTDCAEWKQEER